MKLVTLKEYIVLYMRYLKITIILSFLLLTSCTSLSKKLLLEVDAVGQQASLESDIKEADLYTLLNRATSSSPNTLKTRLETIILKSSIDKNISEINPTLSMQANLEKSPFIRSDGDTGYFRILPILYWDIFKYFEMEKTKNIQNKLLNKDALSKHLTIKQVRLEIINLYFKYVLLVKRNKINRRLILDFTNRIGIIKIKISKSHLFELHSKKRNIEAEIIKLKDNNKTITAQIESIRLNLLSISGLPMDTIVHSNFEPINLDYKSDTLKNYIEKVLINSEKLKISKIDIQVSNENIKLTQLQKWTKFNLYLSIEDVFQSGIENFYGVLSWSYDLIDQGKYHRKLLQAKVKKITSLINEKNEKNEVTKTAIKTWLSLLDAKTNFSNNKDKKNKSNLKLRKALKLFNLGLLSKDDLYRISHEDLNSNLEYEESIFQLNMAKIYYSSLKDDNFIKWFKQ